MDKARKLRTLKAWVRAACEAWGEDRTAAGLQRALGRAASCRCEGCKG